MNSWNSQLFKTEGRARGIPKNIIDSATEIAKQLKYAGLPPIFTLNHLSHLCGVKYSTLRHIVERKYNDDAYKVFKLKKSGVGFSDERVRFISVPNSELFKVQRWIHNNILKLIPAHENSFAFHSNGGILKAAYPHCNKKWMIKLDVSNYFESILEPTVYNAFLKMGYEPLVSFELARVCTRVKPHHNPVKKNRINWLLNTDLPYKTIEIGHLPQGAPTSPLLSNICSIKLDELLSDFADVNNLTYTRYADDIVFSSADVFDRDLCNGYIKNVYSIMRENNLWPNRTKTKIIPPGARKIVLGLLVDTDRPRLTKEYKKEILTHLYYISNESIGLEKHCKARGFDSVYGFLNFINGKLTYANFIDPEWSKPLIYKLKCVARLYINSDSPC
ncbi:reverse transcriptase family protein [Pectobacterium sp. HCp5_1]|uniref:reverse transcriptase family protein n=1 Tax=Pectobacterium sp. HCp5_1 TaxID=3062446 RepID=UPI00293BA28E|nr:reverse transcriptase family protein [Pectobacterium sp. HCp5_1]